MRTRTYPDPDGSAIPFARAYYYVGGPDSTETVATYGLLYDWYSAVNSMNPTRGVVQGICPDGWHVPSKEDLELLDNYPVTELLSKDPDFWIKPGTDDHGFTILPAGRYNSNTHKFVEMKGTTGFWSCDSETPLLSNCVRIKYYCEFVQFTLAPPSEGLSVRCVMNY
jgi:uncharacterized protein (TIGR02145 family)